jgi:hypothetical protein
MASESESPGMRRSVVFRFSGFSRFRIFRAGRRPLKIRRTDFRNAQKSSAMKRFLAEAMEQERRLEQEGLISRASR